MVGVAASPWMASPRFESRLSGAPSLSLGLTDELPTLSTTGIPLSGGRTWWAHFEFTRINIEPIILRKKIEDLCETRADEDSPGRPAGSLSFFGQEGAASGPASFSFCAGFRPAIGSCRRRGL